MSVTFEHVVFDCADPLALARFWAEVLERPLDEGSTAHFATVGMPTRRTASHSAAASAASVLFRLT